MTPNLAPVSVSLRLEGRSIVRGCPGVSRSMVSINELKQWKSETLAITEVARNSRELPMRL